MTFSNRAATLSPAVQLACWSAGCRPPSPPTAVQLACCSAGCRPLSLSHCCAAGLHSSWLSSPLPLPLLCSWPAQQLGVVPSPSPTAVQPAANPRGRTGKGEDKKGSCWELGGAMPDLFPCFRGGDQWKFLLQYISVSPMEGSLHEPKLIIITTTLLHDALLDGIWFDPLHPYWGSLMIDGGIRMSSTRPTPELHLHLMIHFVTPQ
jgi:hypothetical protein